MSDDSLQHLLLQISEVLSARIGLWFPPDRFRELQRGLKHAAGEMGFDELEPFLHFLLAAPLSRERVEMLARHLTIGETYFFRDARSFEVLQNQILRPLISNRQGKTQTLRLWSAACSSGEEPYSLAILLREMLPRPEDWKISILATDLNPNALQRARRAEYSAWSFRALSIPLRDKYFHAKSDNRFVLCDEVKRMVRFEFLNLIEDAFPSPVSDTNAMDVILCRNVLMYFAPVSAQNVIDKLHRSLRDGGYLLTSANEGPHINYNSFKALHFPGAIVYRKSQQTDKTAETSARTLKSTRPSTLEQITHKPSTLKPNILKSSDKNARPTSIDLEKPLAQNKIKKQLSPESIVSQKPLTKDPAAENSITRITIERDLQRAHKLLAGGFYAPAIAILETAFSEAATLDNANGTQGEIAGLLARCQLGRKDLQSALQWSEQALRADKLSAGFYYLHAVILQEKNEIEKAIAALRRALYLDSDFVAAHLMLGHLARFQSNHSEAQRHFTNAMQVLSRLDENAQVPELEGATAGKLSSWVEQLRNA